MLASETRRLAREALTGKWGKAALVMLVYMILTSIISVVLNLIPVVGSLIQIAINIPIAYGLISTFMKLKRGEDVSYTGFLTDGLNNFANAWKVGFWTLVKMIVPVIVLIVAIVLLSIGSGTAIVGSSSSSSSASTVTGVGGSLAVIGTILSCVAYIWLIVKSYYYQLVYFILFDNPERDAKEIVAESESLMTGNRGKLFCLQLSFIGWMILAGFTFGIGMLWLIPYMTVAEIVFYEVLAGKKSDTVEAKVEEASAEPVQEDNGPISE